MPLTLTFIISKTRPDGLKTYRFGYAHFRTAAEALAARSSFARTMRKAVGNECRVRATTLYERLSALTASGRIVKAGNGGYRLIG